MFVLFDFGAVVLEGLFHFFEVVGYLVGLELVLLHVALEHLYAVSDLLVCQVRHLLHHSLCHLKYF